MTAWHLLPDVRSEFNKTLRAVCGPCAEPLDVLRLAASCDERARRWLEEVEMEDDDPRLSRATASPSEADGYGRPIASAPTSFPQ